MNVRLTLLVSGLVLVLTSTSPAQIATYDFNGAPGNQASTAASGVAANMTAGAISRGSGVTAATLTDSINSTGWTTSSTLSTNDYYTFTITPNAGFWINFTNIQYNVERSNQGATIGAVRSSLDGYTANIGSTFAITTTPTEQTINLSAMAFQNISSAITFRIYGYDAGNSSGSFRLFYSSGSAPGVQVNGTVVAIPEAEAYVFASMGIGLVGFGYYRKRRASLALA